MLARIEALVDGGRIRPIDFIFARFLQQQVHADDETVLAACLVSQRAGQGHVCLDLAEVAGNDPFATQDECGSSIVAPTFGDWCRALRCSAAVAAPGETAPLILDSSGRLYLSRYWSYESGLARTIGAKAGRTSVVDDAWLQIALERYFPPTSTAARIDWQKVAAGLAVLRPFAVVSGGPGTGKTTAVARILALLLEQAGEQPLRIALAAPTGKAAARLTESIRNSKHSRAFPLPADPDILARIPETAQTLHRLLGIRPLRTQPRHHAGNPLAVDVMVVDEASMVDLPLMAKLLAALPDEARLILLGDKDQLSSVEAGKVLGDLCKVGVEPAYSAKFSARLQALTGESLGDSDATSRSALNDCVVVLRHSHRFAGAIGVLAGAVNAGDADTALSTLRTSGSAAVSWRNLSARCLEVELAGFAVGAYRGHLEAAHRGDAELALACLDRYRVLCALREGPTGVVAINAVIERALRRAGLIEARERWYPGRPVMVTRNDYALRLFNGDIGVIMPDRDAGGRLRAFFRPSGQDTDGGALRTVSPSRLPEHETVYAMTVHKSQGSEFEHIDLVLADQASPVLTRELVYTGITRARNALRLWGRESVFRQALASTVVRASGLRQALWG